MYSSFVRRSFSVIPFVLCALFTACQSSTPTAPTASAPQVVAAAPTASSDDPGAPTPHPASNVVSAVRIEPASLVGGAGAVGTVTLTTAAPAGGTVVTLTSSDRDVEVPATVTVAAGQTTVTFPIGTHPPHSDQTVRITATASGVTQTSELRLLLQTPGARSDEYTTAQGAPLVVAAPGILDNDTRRTGHDLVAELVRGPISGTLTLLATGGFTYRPNPGFHGRDRFIYRALDGTTTGNQQHVWINVTAAGPTPPALPPAPPTGSQTFFFTGAAQTFIVPAGVGAVVIEAYGGQGGTGMSFANPGGTGGLGASLQATLSVTPGTTLQVNVGGVGALASTGAGGGGASDVRNGGNPSGGGAGGGGGGTQAAGGAGGLGGANGAAGTSGTGGAGSGTAGVPAGGGFNGGGNARNGGGGGGGGLFGGGGGGLANSGAGGGGGSSFAAAGATSVVHQQGVRTGHGVVIIRW